jgi:hypothetical protein
MAKFVYAYKGGSVAQNPEEREKAMAAWGAWFGGLGDAVVDMGNPFAGSTAVATDGSTTTSTAGLTGYSIVTADSLELAAKLAHDCPVLAGGGSVEVYEAHEIM